MGMLLRRVETKGPHGSSGVFVYLLLVGFFESENLSQLIPDRASWPSLWPVNHFSH